MSPFYNVSFHEILPFHMFDILSVAGMKGVDYAFCSIATCFLLRIQLFHSRGTGSFIGWKFQVGASVVTHLSPLTRSFPGPDPQATRVLAQVLVAGATVLFRAGTQAWQQALHSE